MLSLLVSSLAFAPGLAPLSTARSVTLKPASPMMMAMDRRAVFAGALAVVALPASDAFAQDESVSKQKPKPKPVDRKRKAAEDDDDDDGGSQSQSQSLASAASPLSPEETEKLAAERRVTPP